MTGPDPDDVTDPRQIAQADRAAAAYWRETAELRTEALHALRHRTSVRIALRIERLLEPLRRPTRTATDRAGRLIRRMRLTTAALPRRPLLRARRRATARALAPARTAASLGDVQELTFDPEADPRATTSRLAEAIDRSSSAFTLVRRTSVEPMDADVRTHLRAAMADDVAVVTAHIVHGPRPLRIATPHDGATWSRGISIDEEAGIPHGRAIDAGRGATPREGVDDVDAAPASCVLVRCDAVRSAGGFRISTDVDAAMIDLCVRLRHAGWRTVVAGAALAEDCSRIDDTTELTEPVPVTSPAWRLLVDEHGAELAEPRRADAELLRFAITTAVPSARLRERWGDWHLASALGRSLRRAGHRVRVQTAAEADDLASRAVDVHLVIRGLSTVRRTPGQLHVLWIVSHPESVTTAECDEADLVLVASERFAAALRARTTTPVDVLLQATDHRRFRPVSPVPEHRHEITIVAKSRERRRDVVDAALAAGLRPAIHGSGWEGLVEPELVVAEHVPNEELPAVYSSAGVVLNDHWNTMRAWGFVSNRIFDVLSCGTPVISDHLPEIAQLFDDAVPTYRDASELRAHVDEVLVDPTLARQRAAAGRQLVLGRHTFDHRATELLASLRAWTDVGGRAETSPSSTFRGVGVGST